MNKSFFALVFRQKYIKRWGLMRNTYDETLAEHSSEVAVISHALATIGNEIYGKNYDIGRIVTLAVFHDVPEVSTGDLPTPVKYHSEKMRTNYKEIENESVENLVSHIPDEFKGIYRDLLDAGNDPLYKIVKAADTICAYIKCIDEEKSGNTEFISAKKALSKKIKSTDLEEVDYFIENFLPAFSLSLDDMQK